MKKIIFLLFIVLIFSASCGLSNYQAAFSIENQDCFAWTVNANPGGSETIPGFSTAYFNISWDKRLGECINVEFTYQSRYGIGRDTKIICANTNGEFYIYTGLCNNYSKKIKEYTKKIKVNNIVNYLKTKKNKVNNVVNYSKIKKYIKEIKVNNIVNYFNYKNFYN